MNYRTKAFFQAVIVLCLSAPGGAWSKARRTKSEKTPEIFQVMIQSCHDGDTCTAFTDPPKKEKIKIRFAGIDAPEIKQTGGEAAQKALAARLVGKSARIECQGKSFDRHTCLVFLGADEINRWMVSEGWAWESPKFSKGRYTAAQTHARAAKKGIWATAQVSPYCFRHRGNRHCRTSQTFNP